MPATSVPARVPALPARLARQGELVTVRGDWPRAARAILAAALAAAAASCSTFQGYPPDPEDTSVTLDALKAYFDPAKEAAYSSETNADKRQQLRDTIVLSRVRAYDIEFDRFESNFSNTAIPSRSARI